MKVRFLKYCPWSLSGKVEKFRAGTSKDVPEKDALSMIKNGYAEEVIEVEEKRLEPEEEEEERERGKLYKDNFDLNGLKQFCSDNEIPHKPSIHRTIPALIKVILDYEEEHGQFNLKENDE